MERICSNRPELKKKESPSSLPAATASLLKHVKNMTPRSLPISTDMVSLAERLCVLDPSLKDTKPTRWMKLFGRLLTFADLDQIHPCDIIGLIERLCAVNPSIKEIDLFWNTFLIVSADALLTSENDPPQKALDFVRRLHALRPSVLLKANPPSKMNDLMTRFGEPMVHFLRDVCRIPDQAM